MCCSGTMPCQRTKASTETHDICQDALHGESKFKELIDYMLFICETSLIAIKDKLHILIPEFPGECLQQPVSSRNAVT